MEIIKECYSVNAANDLIKEGYILSNTHLLTNDVIVYIMIKKA